MPCANWRLHKLSNHGVLLGHGCRLTNLPYGDDVILFATSSHDKTTWQVLIPELAVWRWFASEFVKTENFHSIACGQLNVCWLIYPAIWCKSSVLILRTLIWDEICLAILHQRKMWILRTACKFFGQISQIAVDAKSCPKTRNCSQAYAAFCCWLGAKSGFVGQMSFYKRTAKVATKDRPR